MSAALPRSVTYVRRQVGYIPCSTDIEHLGITEEQRKQGKTRGHGRYGTSLGLTFCALCYRRKLVIELATRLFDTWGWNKQEMIRRSVLYPWIEMAIHGSDIVIQQTLIAFREEMEELGVSEELL